MKKTPIIAVIAIALVILVGATYEGGEVETASIAIEGMRCGACCSKVETALAGQTGVKTVSVDLDAKLAVVEYYPSKVTSADLKKAVCDAGFAVNEAACKYSAEKAKAVSEGAACSVKAKKKAI